MKFLVCTDGSEYGDKTVKYAAEFSKNYKAYKPDLTILYVVEVLYPVSDEELSRDPAFEEKKAEAEDIISRARILAHDINKDIECQERVAWGSVASEIVKIAEDEEFNAIVIGTKGLSRIKRMLLGSVADKVIRHAHCPVAIVR